MFSRCSQDVLKMFSRCSQDVLRISQGGSGGSGGPGGFGWTLGSSGFC